MNHVIENNYQECDVCHRPFSCLILEDGKYVCLECWGKWLDNDCKW